MRRRDFITLLGTAVAWPVAARAQQREQMRRIGVLMNLGSDDAEGQARNAAFLQGLQELGWTVGRNVRIDTRWGGGDMASAPRSIGGGEHEEGSGTADRADSGSDSGIMHIT